MDTAKNKQDEIAAFLSSLGDGQVRSCSVVMLFPIEQILGLVDVRLREAWAAVRRVRRGLPTFRTAQKLTADERAQRSVSSASKYLRELPTPRRALGLTKYQLENGYNAPVAIQWLSLLEHCEFTQPAVLEYWEEKLYQISDFSANELKSTPCKVSRFRTYNKASIVSFLGCPEARIVIDRVLRDSDGDDDVDSNTELKHAMVADAFSALLRLAAWMAAEAQVANWEWEIIEKSQNKIHALWAVPTWCSSSETWSNPMVVALEKLATAAGWTGKKQNPVTFLGKIWAQSDGMDESSKIRLLRNWAQLKHGRPSFKSLMSLVRLCFNLHVQVRNDLPADVHVAYWQGACWFRFAETMAIILRDAQKDGWPSDLIASLMSVYEAEYRTARELMGKPLIDGDTATEPPS